MLPSSGLDLSLPRSIFLSIIIFILFLLMLGGIYMLFSFHHKKALSPAINAPMLRDEWFSGYASEALSSTSPIFGRLFARPKKDENEWILLKKIDQRFLWVCIKTAKMGFWTLDLEGTPLWREVPLDRLALSGYLCAEKIQDLK
ncbi:MULTISPECIES: hypothetical protein [Acidithiobacillus]|uniref:Uncharacterized protein n=2 Tax=Acidithiobacillus thiooxidans TaxID=930 RepID=A0A1C2J8D8_ACITH|nr:MULTISPECIES: hypothetical protein [Acidithiobacillus]MBU2743436.1 hypothetical protein [Acidithiobacillus albertensis]MBU2751808.1 hypothetical protein [Acidithiobacillus thiooxidans]MBU2795155.1 hypothetical protein [Acidithiobacillus thiooxidans]MBU2841800.1 hypothetical protein [Acidithiobacillus thiooxidans]OCX68660.1 hypothetical protein A6P07_17800 [Acidithiobacillus thiooxidans]